MLAPGDTAPDFEEICALLHCKRRRGVVGANRGDLSDLLPKASLFFSWTQRWCAFRNRPETDHVFIGQDKVMWASLASHIDAAGPRFRDGCDPAAATDVHDVKAAAGFFRQREGGANRLQLGLYGARFEIAAHIGFAGGRAPEDCPIPPGPGQQDPPR